MKEGNEKGPDQKITRREFLSKTGVALSAVALNTMLPKSEAAAGSVGQDAINQSLKIKGAENLQAVIPAEHLEIYIKKIFPKIVSHLAEIHKKLGKAEYDIDLKNLYHVHLYFKDELDDPKAGSKLARRENDITYLYHAKELMRDTTKRNIIIDNKGRFETIDGDGVHPEGRELVQINFADSLEEFESMVIESGRFTESYLDKNSLFKVGNIYFAIANNNYKP